MLWTPIITLDSVDVSASITGEIRVEGEESTSRIASFVMKPASGTVSAGDWLGVAVTIDYATVDSVGAILTQDRIFTGVVDQAIYNPDTKLTSFSCTDDLQGQMEAKTQAQVDALITGSRWSEAVFGEYQDGWLHLENLLETIPKSYDYNVDGVTGTLADWAAKTTPDYSYDSSSIVSGSIQYNLAPRRELYNESTIEYSYRFRRLKHREHGYSWQPSTSISGWGFCVYFQDSHELPTRELITSAAEGAGWKIQQPMDFGALPKSNPDPCGIAAPWSISQELWEQLVISAGWTAVKRWTQEATETYTLTVNAPQSQSWLGTVAFSDSVGEQTETDAEGWEQGTETPAGSRVDSLGDYVLDQYDRAVSNNDIETLIARARTEILSAHRGNWVEADIVLNPSIERFHTVSLSANGIVGKGKVSSIIHSMDTDSGEAVSTVRVAISLNGGAVAGGDSTISAPAAPNTDPVTTPPATNTILPTYIGNDDTAPNFDDAWLGFTGNYSAAHGFPTTDQVYPRRFKVETQDINQDAIDHAEGSASATYSFDIPDETLTITV